MKNRGCDDMKNYSKVSKFGIIVSIIAMLISAINILSRGMNRTAIVVFCCTSAIFCSNIVIAEASKKKAEKNQK